MSSQRSASGRLTNVVSAGSAVALASAIAVGLFMIAMPLAYKVIEPANLPPPFPSPNQGAETAIYMAMVFLVVPFSILASTVSNKRILSGPNRDSLPSLIAALVTLLGLGILLMRLSPDLPWRDGIKASLAGGILWMIIAGFSLWRAGSDRSWRPASLISRHQRPLFVAAGLSVVAGSLSFVRFGNVDVSVLFLGLFVAALVAVVYCRTTPKQIPRRWGIASDLVVLALVLMAVPDIVMLYPEAAVTDPELGLMTYVVQFHQSLFLGAASQVLHGSTLLVDTVSQYGVGSVYLIAAFFKIAPIGNLTLGFFDGALTAGMFGLGYGILRMSGVNRLLAATAMFTAVVTLAWGLKYPVGGLLQHGAIRFGLPMLLIAPVVAGARWPRIRPVSMWMALMVVGMSAIWALEAFIYVTFTALGLIVIAATWQPRDQLRRWLLTVAGYMVAAWVVTHILFALITFAASGSLPEWGLYVSYLRDFLAGEIGDLTYDFSRWSPSLLVVGVYLVSTVALVTAAVTNREYVEGRRATFLALAGLTAYGVVLFSYFDNRSLDHVLPYVCLPALLVATIWLGLILDTTTGFTRRTRAAALASGLAVAALAIANVWPAAGHRAEDSLLAYAIPGGNSLSQGIDRIWNPPPIKDGALSGELLVNRYFPGQDRIPVVTEPDLDVEILDRTERANQLGITDAKENSWVPGPHQPRIEAATAGLQAGDRILLDSPAFRVLQVYRAHPDIDRARFSVLSGLQAIQINVLESVARRFDLRLIEEGDDGMYVVQLEAK